MIDDIWTNYLAGLNPINETMGWCVGTKWWAGKYITFCSRSTFTHSYFTHREATNMLFRARSRCRLAPPLLLLSLALAL